MSESGHDNDCNYEVAPPRPKKRSLVWQFFERLNQFRIRCYLCQHQQNYQGTTGNILRHMKSKHDVDLTLKGQQDPENQKRIKELCSAAIAVSGKEIKMERYSAPNSSKNARKGKQPVADGFELNTHEKNDEGIYPLETYLMSEDPFHEYDDIKRNKPDLNHARIKAETRYLSERAGYYKLLKRLTVLQAKKDKIERELLTTNNDNTTV